MRRGGMSSSRDDLHDFQPVSCIEPTLRELRRSDCLTVVLHDDAARQKTLRDEELIEGAGQLRLDWLSVSNDRMRVHWGDSWALIVISSLSPKILFFPADRIVTRLEDSKIIS